MSAAQEPIHPEKGIIHMVSRVVLFHPSTGVLRPARQMNLEFVPARETSLLEFPGAGAISPEMWDTVPPALGCMRAIRYALGIEAAAALTIYGLWHLVHMLR